MRSIQTSTPITPLTIVYDGTRWWCEGVEITGVQFHYSATTTFIELAQTPCGYQISQQDAAWLQLDQAPQKFAGGRFPTHEAAQIARAQFRAALLAARPAWPRRLWQALRRLFVPPVLVEEQQSGMGARHTDQSRRKGDWYE
jgi:hypothetical protein